MVDKRLRGTRPGGGPASVQPDRDENLAPRRRVIYRCAKGHAVAVVLAASAEAPPVWPCPNHGVDAALDQSRSGADQDAAASTGKPARTRTPLDMLLERRRPEELEALVDEQLARLRARRRGHRR